MQPVPIGAQPISSLVEILESAGASALGAALSAQPAVPGVPSVDPAPDDLVARALAILAEETRSWHARQASNMNLPVVSTARVLK
jgi:hypothetical protein